MAYYACSRGKEENVGQATAMKSDNYPRVQEENEKEDSLSSFHYLFGCCCC